MSSDTISIKSESLKTPDPKYNTLPHSQSTDLTLKHPTPIELQHIYHLTSLAWKDALTLPQYLEESITLSTAPLAKNGYLTNWILTSSNHLPNNRPILASCETFLKHAFTTNQTKQPEKKVVHGVASVFTDPKYRGHGYAGRLMRELSKVLRSWQDDRGDVVGSILYSDIGKRYYAKFGWCPVENNTHIEILSSPQTSPSAVKPIYTEDLAELCKDDEKLLRESLARKLSGTAKFAIVPDLDHVLWHHAKENFGAEILLGKIPSVKGGVTGVLGDRMWLIWARRFYEDPRKLPNSNTLYILRLVIENQSQVHGEYYNHVANPEIKDHQASSLRELLRAAQNEAAAWGLGKVVMWDPSPLVRELLIQSGLSYLVVEREKENIASLLWFGDENEVEFVANEKYAWC